MFRQLACVIVLSVFTSVLMANELSFPGANWETISPEAAGWNSARLDSAIDFAFKSKSSSVVILHGGRILAERHGDVNNGSFRYQAMTLGKTKDKHVIEDVASVQKSVVSFLVGVAIEKGLVRLDDPVSKHLGAGWSHAKQEQEAAITLRHLITMTSGLNARLEYLRPPGTKWMYNSTAYAKTLACLESAAKLSNNELTSQWLFEKIGMKDSRWSERRRAQLVEEGENRFGLATTARDLARFGLLIQAKGKWNDTVVLADHTYLGDSLRPSQSLNSSYGYLWWVNDQSVVDQTGKRAQRPMIPTAPADLFAAKGALGRRCYVVPSLNLVVTRIGDTPSVTRGENFDNEFWRLIMLAAAK